MRGSAPGTALHVQQQHKYTCYYTVGVLHCLVVASNINDPLHNDKLTWILLLLWKWKSKNEHFLTRKHLLGTIRESVLCIEVSVIFSVFSAITLTCHRQGWVHSQLLLPERDNFSHRF